MFESITTLLTDPDNPSCDNKSVSYNYTIHVVYATHLTALTKVQLASKEFLHCLVLEIYWMLSGFPVSVQQTFIPLLGLQGQSHVQCCLGAGHVT